MTYCYVVDKRKGIKGYFNLLACYTTPAEAWKHAEAEIAKLRTGNSVICRPMDLKRPLSSERWSICDFHGDMDADTVTIRAQKCKMLERFDETEKKDDNDIKQKRPSKSSSKASATKRALDTKQEIGEEVPAKRQRHFTGKEKSSSLANSRRFGAEISEPAHSSSEDSESEPIPIPSSPSSVKIQSVSGSPASVDDFRSHSRR